MKKLTTLSMAILASFVATAAMSAPKETQITERYFTPQLAPQPTGKQSVSSDGSLPNDAEFQRLQYSYMHSSLTEATVGNQFIGSWLKSQTKQTKKIRVGLIDAGFAPHPDINYASESADFFERDSDAYSEKLMREMSLCVPHGTYVASIIAAKSNNGVGIFGAGNNVEVVPARVAACSEGSAFDLNDGIAWLAGKSFADEGIADISHPVDVINISRAGYSDCPIEVQESIDYAISKGITVVAGAGNGSVETALAFPANCKGVIAVSATDINDNQASFTNYGSFNDITARGDDLAVYGLDDPSLPNKAYVGDGTSFSTPLVSAAIANVLSVTDGLTPAEVKYLLLSTSTEFSDTTTCTVDSCGEGHLNNDKLVEAGELYQAGNLSYIKQALPYGNACDKQLLIETFGESLPLCGMLELTLNALGTERDHVTYNVYRAPKGTAIDVNDSATELFISDTKKTTQLVPDFDIESFDYGFTVCFSDDCSDDVIHITTYEEKDASCD
ncbi:S8 family serine peptidase [Shewanella sp. MF05960]|uniref:S8 family serine peptidase n=1 Tax=Shewanella sp. MF05960 TaxID=3434874 RepID=UPI003D793010